MIRWYLDYIGVWPMPDNFHHTSERYTPVNNRIIAEKYLKYLEDLSVFQKDRKQTIESKNSLLIGQASIVFSIVGLFIPLFNGQLDGLNKWLVIAATTIFINAIIHYILTILFSIKNLEINKLRYSVGSTTTVTKQNRNLREIDFLNEQIKDLVFAINYNIRQIDIIGDNLIYASRNFKVANISFFALTVILILLLAIKNTETPKVEVINISKISCCDTISDIQLIKKVISIEGNIQVQTKIIDSLTAKINLLIKLNKTSCKRRKPIKPKEPCP